MAEILTPEALRERLNQNMPGVVVPPPPEPEPGSDDTKPAEKGKGKADHGPDPAEMLKTNDIIVEAGRMVEVATYMRDVLGYAYLSDIAAVDYLAAGMFELVYLFYHPDGGTGLKIKVRVPRDQPDVPSITPIWPGADFNEREAYDLFGINFVGHPYLQRIYMWDEFEGHPMRKDFPKQGDKYLGEA